MSKLISLTPAQFRTLRRVSRSTVACTRWNAANNAQILALVRKQCVVVSYGNVVCWAVTVFGRHVLASNGKARFGESEHIL